MKLLTGQQLLRRLSVSSTNSPRPTRALVLGGGGVLGLSWEIGVLTGLLRLGTDLGDADVVIGTSAGAFSATALLSGPEALEAIFASQLEPADNEVAAAADPAVLAEYATAFGEGGEDAQLVARLLGDVAKRHPEPISRAARRVVVRSRLPVTDWPSATLQVTALDADTGELCAFSQSSGVDLLDAVAASGAVPGIWPLEEFGGRRWIDGGMTSAANPRLATGYDKILIIAPSARGLGRLASASQDAEELARAAEVVLVVPDADSVTAIGPNALDPTRRREVAFAGLAQSDRELAAVSSLWG